MGSNVNGTILQLHGIQALTWEKTHIPDISVFRYCSHNDTTSKIKSAKQIINEPGKAILRKKNSELLPSPEKLDCANEMADMLKTFCKTKYWLSFTLEGGFLDVFFSVVFAF